MRSNGKRGLKRRGRCLMGWGLRRGFIGPHAGAFVPPASL